MDKHKILGIVNSLLSIPQITLPIIIVTVVIPRLTELYAEFGLRPSFFSAYTSLGLVVLMGVANLFLGFKLFSKTEEPKEKYFKYGVVLAAGTLVLSIVFLAIANALAASVIYNLTSEL